MTLRVTNTLTGEVEPFESDDETVRLYLCGLTTSDPAHLGHARVWVHTDVIHRWLEYRGYTVEHVENFTDVNEKIVARIGEIGTDEHNIGEQYIEEFLRDMRSLNLKRATIYPRVTEHIDEIIEMIESLIERGYAYESNGSVYFDVTAFDDYGKLSNQDLDDLQAQGDPTERAEKRHAADFALWKAGGVQPDDIAEHQHAGAAAPETACTKALTWESPWSEGRPGWHIECSAMSTAYLGDTFDIHVAGEDLVFPHNENEIAQAEAAHDAQFARYWLHVGLLETEDEKMSSSLKNFFTVENAIAEFGPNVVRTFLLSTTYSEKQTYSEAALNEAQDRFERLQRAYQHATSAVDDPAASPKAADAELRTTVEETYTAVETAMDADFNTRKALASLDELASAIFRHVDHADQYDYPGLRQAITAFETFGTDVLGLQFGTTSDGSIRLAEELVELLIELRETERAQGNYERADRIRDELTALGVTIEDTADGTRYQLDG